jgi:hypothetical protein
VVATYLDEVLALWLCDERLQLRRSESVDKTGLGDDEQQHLRACQDGQFVGLRLGWLAEGSRVHNRQAAVAIGGDALHCTARKTIETYLLHDTSLALREGDVPTRLILDELDLDLSTLAARLVIVVVLVVGSCTRTLDAAVLHAHGAIAVVVDGGRRVLVVLGDFAGHGVESRCRLVTRGVWRTRALNCLRRSVGSWQAFLRWASSQNVTERTADSLSWVRLKG